MAKRQINLSRLEDLRRLDGQKLRAVITSMPGTSADVLARLELLRRDLPQLIPSDVPDVDTVDVQRELKKFSAKEQKSINKHMDLGRHQSRSFRTAAAGREAAVIAAASERAGRQVRGAAERKKVVAAAKEVKADKKVVAKRTKAAAAAPAATKVPAPKVGLAEEAVLKKLSKKELRAAAKGTKTSPALKKAAAAELARRTAKKSTRVAARGAATTTAQLNPEQARRVKALIAGGKTSTVAHAMAAIPGEEQRQALLNSLTEAERGKLQKSLGRISPTQERSAAAFQTVFRGPAEAAGRGGGRRPPKAPPAAAPVPEPRREPRRARRARQPRAEVAPGVTEPAPARAPRRARAPRGVGGLPVLAEPGVRRAAARGRVQEATTRVRLRNRMRGLSTTELQGLAEDPRTGAQARVMIDEEVARRRAGIAARQAAEAEDLAALQRRRGRVARAEARSATRVRMGSPIRMGPIVTPAPLGAEVGRVPFARRGAPPTRGLFGRVTGAAVAGRPFHPFGSPEARAGVAAAARGGRGALRFLPGLGQAFGIFEIANLLDRIVRRGPQEERRTLVGAIERGLEEGGETRILQSEQESLSGLLDTLGGLERTTAESRAIRQAGQDVLLDQLLQRNQATLGQLSIRTRPSAGEMLMSAGLLR